MNKRNQKKNVGKAFFRCVTQTDGQSDGRTDGETDRQTESFLVARPRCMQCMHRGKNESGDNEDDELLLFNCSKGLQELGACP